jgi:hypothetical protein
MAIRLDSDNATRWLAFEERERRWQNRIEEEKPPRLRITYSCVDEDPLGNKLGQFMGMLSDTGTHFTPELLGSLSFEEKKGGRLVFSNYLESDFSIIASELRYLAATHLVILRALAQACNIVDWESSELAPYLQEIASAARALDEKYPFKRRPELDEELGIS